MSLEPGKVVATFDSASVLHASVVAALEGHDFPHLGNSDAKARLARVGSRMPWPILRQIYARIGGAEGLPADQLGEVDMSAIAASFADAYPRGRYPAALIGASNGALAHLAAAMRVPWLPVTVLVPVHRVADAQRPDLALEFGAEVVPALLDANPDIVVHQMHDAAQDEIMVARMSYLRPKWQRMPRAYARFLEQNLAPEAPVLLVDDRSRWPVTRVGARHVFQVGGRGGLTPDDYLRTPHAPAADDEAPEAEWGTPPSFAEDVAAWAASHGHPLVRISVDGPQEAAHPVAVVMRTWLRSLGQPADRLLVPSFVLGDPHRTITMGAVPFWTFFPVRSALDALDHHLAHSEPYARVDAFLFEHGARSAGRIEPADLERVIRAHGAEPHLDALRSEAVPHDLGALARYGPWMDAQPTLLPRPPALPVSTSLAQLARVEGPAGTIIG